MHLVLTALGGDRPGLVTEISQVIFNNGCDIVDSRMIALGGEFALLMQVTGSWNAVTKVEDSLLSLEAKIGMRIHTQRTTSTPGKLGMLPYAIDVVSLDHPGVVFHLASYFSGRGINIEELSTDTYFAPHTGTPMFAVHMEVGVPSNQSIAELRESFMVFCDRMNLDAVMEPVKS